MVEQGKIRIKIDLNQFKLHIHLRDKMGFSLHFNSPSRRFYLAIIALIATEMKRLGKIVSIPLEDHYETVALLNETIGGQAGSSSKEQLLPRVYRKWMDALPDLDHAPLFKVLGRTKEYEDAAGKTYAFTDEEKDAWANLFDYKGSHENVRLRFSVDTLGVTLDEVVIVYGDDPELVDAKAWGSFLEGLTQEAAEKPLRANRISEGPVTPVSLLARWRGGRWRWPTLALAIGVVGFLIWKSAFYSPQDEVSPLEKAGYRLPDKPSIAVLPFDNFSDDPDQEYFSDGMTEEIITGLSKIPQVFVIARNSSFTYKGRAVQVQQVGRELGVRYVLEGSVRKYRDRVRVTAQLSDATSGHHLWAERYDRKLKDIFAIQDEITKRILEALQVKLTEGEHARLWGKGTNNIDAYLKYVEARTLWRRFINRATNAQARQMALEAIALDPEYAMAHGMLGYTHWSDLVMNWSESRKDSMEQLVKSCQRALALDDSVPMLHSLNSHIYLMKKQFDKALAEGEQAVAMCPNCSENMILLGHILRYTGRPKDAIAVLERAIRLDPFPPVMAYHNLATSCLFAGMLNEALATYKKALSVEPDNLPANIGLAVTYSALDKIPEARRVGAVILNVEPKFSVEAFAKSLPYKNQAYQDLMIDGLRKAGLK